MRHGRGSFPRPSSDAFDAQMESRFRSMLTFTNIKVENFLSLRKLDLELDALNVLVGPNGAGKTNLLKVFQFLGEVARRELAPAVVSIGGFQNLLYRGEHRTGGNVRIELKGMVTKHSSPNALDEYKLSFWRMSLRRGQSRFPAA